MMQVSTNGVLSFRNPFLDFIPETFPLGDSAILIAPFWDDSNNEAGGQVYYRLSDDPVFLDQISSNISDAFEVYFNPVAAFIATWNRIPQFSAPDDVVNTFQAVLTTDGSATYVMFLYRDIQWGDNGTSVGFNAGDGICGFNLPEASTTDGILNLNTTSNIGPGYSGVYIFRVDQNIVTGATDIDECSVDTHNCDPNALCVNTDGGFNCTCFQGFTGNGNFCEDIATYITRARQKRSVAVVKKKAKVSGKEFEDHVVLPIGRMYHCYKRSRGVMERVPAKSIVFYRDCSYERMLAKSMEVYSMDERDNADFYIADSRGTAISEVLLLDANGSDKEVTWTLRRYMSLCNMYPSKARFYCVRKEIIEDDKDDCSKGEDMPNELEVISDDTMPVASEVICDDNIVDSEEVVQTQESRSPLQASSEIQEQELLESRLGSVTAHKSDGMEIDGGLKFQPMFGSRKKSRYRDGYSFITGQDQCGALGSISDEFHECGTIVLPDNPCHFDDVYFCGIDMLGGKESIMMEFAELDDNTGSISYARPKEGEKLEIWTGSCIRSGEHVGILAVVVKGGYHSIAKYQWQYNGIDEEKEVYPIVYATRRGHYSCIVEVQYETFTFSFNIEGQDELWSIESPQGLTISSPLVTPANTGEAELLHLLESAEAKESVNPEAMRIEWAQIIESVQDPTELKLLDIIGQGGFGTVHKAIWHGMVVAAKVIPVQKDVTVKEADIMRMCHHPNISVLLDVIEVKAGTALVTPLVRGHDLQQRIFNDSGDRLTYEQKKKICLQLCQAVLFIHSKSLAHLDIKPANVLIEDITYKVTLTDFGLARVVTHTCQAGTRTMLAGSPGYQPPEQLKAEHVGIHCDIYALGAVFFVTFSETQLWPELNPFQIMFKVTMEAAIPNVQLVKNDTLQTLCKDCFSQFDQRPCIVDVFKHLMKC